MVAFGTDTGGSVRIPASLTGNVGIKTSKGRWSTDGIVPLSSTFDTPGILTKSVADAVFAFEAIDAKSRHSTAKITIKDKSNITLGVTTDYFWDKCQDDIGEVVENTIAESTVDHEPQALTQSEHRTRRDDKGDTRAKDRRQIGT